MHAPPRLGEGARASIVVAVVDIYWIREMAFNSLAITGFGSRA